MKSLHFSGQIHNFASELLPDFLTLFQNIVINNRRRFDLFHTIIVSYIHPRIFHISDNLCTQRR